MQEQRVKEIIESLGGSGTFPEVLEYAIQEYSEEIIRESVWNDILELKDEGKISRNGPEWVIEKEHRTEETVEMEETIERGHLRSKCNSKYNVYELTTVSDLNSGDRVVIKFEQKDPSRIESYWVSSYQEHKKSDEAILNSIYRLVDCEEDGFIVDSTNGGSKKIPNNIVVISGLSPETRLHEWEVILRESISWNTINYTIKSPDSATAAAVGEKIVNRKSFFPSITSRIR